MRRDPAPGPAPAARRARLAATRRALAASAAILALGIATPAGASAEPPTDYTKVEGLSQPDHETVRDSFRVPMHDGKEVYVEVVRPKGKGRYPVVLEASPYHGTAADRDGTRIFPDPKDANGRRVGLTGYFAPRGYAVVMMDLRGTGRSQGCLDHLGPNDARDLERIVEWAAARRFSNGRVGMTGHSYVGSTPAVAAAQKPRGLVTIAPSAGLASMYDHQFQKGVPYYLQWAGPQWAYELLAVDRGLPPEAGEDPVSGGKTGDNFGNDVEETGCGLPNSALTAGSGQVTGQYEGWHAERDWRQGAAAADIPIFMIHGVNDNAARIPAAEWFFEDRYAAARGKDSRGPSPSRRDKVWLGQWDHGSADSSSSRCAGPSRRTGHPNCRFEQWQYALHAWFDKHLQGRDVDTGPPVEVFLNDKKVYTQDRWSPRATPLELHPDASGSALSAADPPQQAQATFTAAPAWTNGTYVDFTSAPVTERTLITGVPKVTLTASTTKPVQLLATVYEKSSGGSLDLRNPVTICAIQPLLREGVEKVAPVVPGRKMVLEPQCFTAGHVLEPGEQLVLRVSAPHRHTNAHHVPMLAGDARVTVHTGPGESTVTLPRITDAALYDDLPGMPNLG